MQNGKDSIDALLENLKITTTINVKDKKQGKSFHKKNGWIVPIAVGLQIGRNLKIPRDQRLCTICNVLEDEFKFFSECKRNTNNPNILYEYFQNMYSNFLELNHDEKLTKIPEQIRTVTSFIRQLLELREGDSSES
jgi:hypothetical protein